MLFVIHALDREGALPVRLANYDAHKAYLSDPGVPGLSIVMSGPLVQDDGETMKGSFFLVEAPDRATAERFHGGDPFKKAGVWGGATVTAFIRRVG